MMHDQTNIKNKEDLKSRSPNDDIDQMADLRGAHCSFYHFFCNWRFYPSEMLRHV